MVSQVYLLTLVTIIGSFTTLAGSTSSSSTAWRRALRSGTAREYRIGDPRQLAQAVVDVGSSLLCT
jgi:hypothetical protein